MALSVLITGPSTHGLWDSSKNQFIRQGTEDEMYQIKDDIERTEQEIDNAKHKDSLRHQYRSQLMKAGHTYDQATSFLKSKMPFLWT